MIQNLSSCWLWRFVLDHEPSHRDWIDSAIQVINMGVSYAPTLYGFPRLVLDF